MILPGAEDDVNNPNCVIYDVGITNMFGILTFDSGSASVRARGEFSSPSAGYTSSRAPESRQHEPRYAGEAFTSQPHFSDQH